MSYLTRCFLLEAAVGPVNAEVPRHPVRGLSDSDPRGTPETIEVAWRNLEQLRNEGLVKIDARLSFPPVLLKPLVLELAHASGIKSTPSGNLPTMILISRDIPPPRCGCAKHRPSGIPGF